MKYIAMAWMLVLLSVAPGLAENLKVKKMNGKVIDIEDQDTGKTWQVRESEVMENGWKVIAVTNDVVTIEKEVSERKRLRAEMPANGLRSLRSGPPPRTP